MTIYSSQYNHPPYEPPQARRKGRLASLIATALTFVLIGGAIVLIDYWPKLCNQFNISAACPSPFPALPDGYRIIAINPDISFVDIADQIIEGLGLIPDYEHPKLAKFITTATDMINRIQKFNELLDCGYNTQSFTVEIDQDINNPWSIRIAFAVKGSYANTMLNVGACFLVQQIFDMIIRAFIQSPFTEPVSTLEPRRADCAGAVDETLGRSANYTLVWLGSSDIVCAAEGTTPPRTTPPDGPPSAPNSLAPACQATAAPDAATGHTATITGDAVNVRQTAPATQTALNDGSSLPILTVACATVGHLECYTTALAVTAGGVTDDLWDRVTFPAGTLDESTGSEIDQAETGFVTNRYVDAGTDVTTIVPNCAATGPR